MKNEYKMTYFPITIEVSATKEKRIIHNPHDIPPGIEFTVIECSTRENEGFILPQSKVEEINRDVIEMRRQFKK